MWGGEDGKSEEFRTCFSVFRVFGVFGRKETERGHVIIMRVMR